MARDGDLKTLAKADGRLELTSAPEGFDALVMADLLRARGGPALFVARDGTRAEAFIGAMAFFAPEIEVVHFPSWDCLPYDRVGPAPGVAATRMATLSRLAAGVDAKKPLLLVAAMAGAMQRVPPRASVIEASYATKPGATVKIEDLERYFAVNGYHRASTVSERGEFAIRGGVIDVYPPAAEEPVRLDLFGDTLESIRAFDPETQRSTKQLHEIRLLPVSEALLDKEAVARFRKGYVGEFGAPGEDALYAAVSDGGRRAGMEHWLPLFYPRLETLFDYLPDEALIAFDHQAIEAREERARERAKRYERTGDWREEGEAPPVVLPPLDQVTGWSKADPAKVPHREGGTLFGGWRIGDWRRRG